ncbi:MAG: MFS transporter [SAR202 cluster bacterium]|nr:MFS transporter [SAR202 cluster bacterium]
MSLKLTAALRQATYPLAILRQRNFGLVWLSTSLAAMGSQMETLVLGWYVLTLTDSPFLVGLLGAARLGLNFLALFAGTIADHVSRQSLLTAVEYVMAALGLIMLGLILSGTLEVWHIFALTLVGGLVRMFQTPSAQSLVADTLAPERIANGAALTTMGRNLATIVGPLAGGVLFEASGAEGAYFAIVLLYVMSGFAALLVRASRTASAKDRGSVLGSTLQGLKYVKGEQVLWATLLVAVIANLTGWPLHTNLMPIFARDVLDTGAAGLGMLMSAFGVGALGGSMVLAWVRNLRYAGRLLLVAIVLWHATMVAFAASTFIPLSLGILVFTGAAFSATQVLMLTVLLQTAPPDYRGRVMGLRVLAIYGHALGSVSSGAVAGAWGAPWAAQINAVVGVALVGSLALVAPKLRRA